MCSSVTSLKQEWTVPIDKVNGQCAVKSIKPVLSGHSKRRPKVGFQDRLSLNAGQEYCRMLQESILQYFRPSLSYHLSLRSLLCLLSGCLRQILLYRKVTC